MSSVKALPVGHGNSPMYVVMDSSHGLKKNAHWSAHDANSQYKRPPHPQLPGGSSSHHNSPPLTANRMGYSYTPDTAPGVRNSTASSSYGTSVVATSSPHMVAPHHHPPAGAGASSMYAANHMFRDAHFQVDTRQQQQQQQSAEAHHALERYAAEHHQQHARRRLSLRPTPEYVAGIERERYMEAMRLQYEREVALGGQFVNAPRSSLKQVVVSVHTPPEMEIGQPGKRPRLAVEPKAPVHQPLVIDTRNIVIKKEPAYTPQVEAISPTLPSEEGRCDSPMRMLKENILGNINRLDKEINQGESQVSKLQKKLHELEAEASKPTVSKEATKDVSHVESKQMSIAQIIYSENRAKALDSHAVLETLGPKVEIPMYNQPSDTAVYHENKRKFLIFKSRLAKFFEIRHHERELRENHLTETYSKLMQEWLKKIEKKENNTTKKAKDAKLREFFEKQFPELKKQREDKERITRVSQRIRSDAEWEEIIDGLQEQELEEKKMRSYAVIPPIRLDSRQRRLSFVNRNGLVEDLSQEYKEKQMLNIWTDQEKDIFREKYLQHPKNFSFIASCLDRKTVADCVQYYYLTKKSENYKQLLRKHSVRKRTRALVKPQQQQQQIAQSSGMTTRQQEDAKSLINLSSTNNSMLPNTDSIVITTAPIDVPASSSTQLSTTAGNEATTNSCSVTTVTSVTLPALIPDSSIPGETKVPDITSDKDKLHYPNNIRKKKEASKKAEDAVEGAGSDSDTNDHRNKNGLIPPCAVCKMEMDNVSQSRPLTKSNCSMFGIVESALVGDMRVCASCRFKSVRRRCPIPTCKTPKRKVKRLRPLPFKLSDLVQEGKEGLISEFQIPADVTKCCSACFNRIIRKLDNSGLETEPPENCRWGDDEMESFKKGLKEFGTDWDGIANVVSSKNKEQCRNFYFNYKRKYGLEEILKEKRKVDRKDRPPPIVTDEEESGETTSSCEEDNCVDRCSSDTASAPSPPEKIIAEDKVVDQHPSGFLPSRSGASGEDHRPQLLPHLDSSPKGPPDYDSSATVSADEGQNQNDNELHDSSSSCVIQPSSHHVKGTPIADPLRKTYNPPLLKEMDNRPVEPGVPLVKTLLQDPNIGAGLSDKTRPSYLDQPAAVPVKKEEPTCVRDLIYQAIEMSLQRPAKPGRNSSPIPTSLNKDSPEIVHVEPKKEYGEPSTAPLPPTAHCGSRRPSRPGSQHTDFNPECEVQDLSKKSRSRDSSPPRELFIKRERIVPPVRPPSETNSSSSHGNYYGAPPPAHCNQYRSSQPPPALSPHYVAEPHHEAYYSRSVEPRSKSYNISERPHSQPPHLVAQASATLSSTPPLQSHSKTIIAKSSVPPPPPLITSKPTQLSPKLSYKERLVTAPPAGSITQGTPVSQQPLPGNTNLASARYEGFLRQLPPPQNKDVGSITLGTPVPHEPARRIPASRDGPGSHIAPGALYEPAMVEFYRQVAPGGQPYPFSPALPGYPSNPPQRPPYANESQLSSKQIMIDFNTSKQMQLRRGITGDKEVKVSPRASDNSAIPEPHLHPMYPPVNYQGPAGSSYTNQLPANYQSPGESKFAFHRGTVSQIDCNHSPSGTDLPVNSCFPHPGKQSPGLNHGANRQNVIQRSITWGTGKSSVIQAPQSSSPRTSDSHIENLTMVRKSTPSPRHPQPLIYQPVPPSGHDAFNTLVNAAVAQPSLIVPKDGKGSPASRQETKSPRDRPVVEGLEKTLIDMHQRPRSYIEPGHRSASHSSHNDHGRSGNDHLPPDNQRQLIGVTPDGHRYPITHSGYDMSRDMPRHAERQILVTEQASHGLRLVNMREPFSREQFERQMRQADTSLPRDRPYPEKEHERPKPTTNESHTTNYSGHSQQSDLDNEASKIFSQSFQKDLPRSSSSPRGLTAANLIDAIITRQINAEPSSAPKNAPSDLFNNYHYEDSKTAQRLPTNSKLSTRAEIVTIDDEPETERVAQSWNERPSSQGRSPPLPLAVQNIPPVGSASAYGADKVVTLKEHIAAIISKDYNSPSDMHQSQSYFNSSHLPVTISGNSRMPNAVYPPSSAAGSKQLEGIAAALPSDGILSAPNIPREMPDHTSQNCPGNGCVYHTHSWKLRRALQQDKEREHRSPASNEGTHSRPVSAHATGSPVGQDERQIIRVSQTSSPSVPPTAVRSSPVTPYAIEPISPPTQTVTEVPTSVENSRNRSIAKSSSSEQSHTQSSWTSNPSITGLLTTRHLYPQEYPENVSSSHYSGTPTSQTNGASSGRSQHQQQMGLSPLDYVKNRIVEVMRTATDENPEVHEARRLNQGQPDERDYPQQQPHGYKFHQNSSEREAPSERPCSTGSGVPPTTSQRYSPAISRYSPLPPRPSSALERVPSRNSTPSELQRHHKRSLDGHHVPPEWRDNHMNLSVMNSQSISPPGSADAQEVLPKKKMRSDSTFIPESTVEHAPILLPEGSTSIHRTMSHGEAPRLSINSHINQVPDGRSSKTLVSNSLVLQSDSYHQSNPNGSSNNCQDYRNLSETRSEGQWDLAHERSSESRLNPPTSVKPSSSVEAISPPASCDSAKQPDVPRNERNSNSMANSSIGLLETSRNSPGIPQGQRSLSMNSNNYPQFSTSVGSTSNSGSSVYSSSPSTSLPQQPVSQHLAYSSFSGMGTTYAYPYSALTMRSLASASAPPPVTNSPVAGSHPPPIAVNNPVRNSPSPLSRTNQPPPLLSSQYEPLSDED